MYSKEFYKLFGKSVKSANIFSFPLIYNPKTKLLQFSPSLHANAVVAHVFLYIFTTSSLWQFIKHLINHDSSLKITYLIIFLSASCGSITIFNITYRSKEVGHLYNSLFTYARNFSGKYKICSNSDFLRQWSIHLNGIKFCYDFPKKPFEYIDCNNLALKMRTNFTYLNFLTAILITNF